MDIGLLGLLDIEGIFIIGYFDDVICEEIYLFTVGL
jgi:hypothetical protein